MRKYEQTVAGVVLCGLAWLAPGVDAAVFVGRLESWGEAARAGIAVGDELISYRSQDGARSRPIERVLQIPALEFLVASGQPVALTLLRGGDEREIELEYVGWEMTPWPGPEAPEAVDDADFRALLNAAGDARYESLWAWIDHQEEFENDQALAALGEYLALSPPDLGGREQAELLSLLAAALARVKRKPESLAALEAAAESFADDDPLRALETQLRLLAGKGLSSPMPELRASLAQLEEQAQPFSPIPPVIAARIAHLKGFYTSVGGDMEGGTRLFETARDGMARIGPRHALIGQLSNNLGINARRVGDYAAAARHYRAALEIYRAQTAESLLLAQVLNNQGVVARNRGDLAAAEEAYRASLQMRRRLGLPASELVAPTGNLINIALDRLDLATAERLQLGLLADLESLPASEHHGVAWFGLGSIYLDQGKSERAEGAYTRALEVHGSLAPAGFRAGSAHWGLGRALAAQGHHRAALAEFLKSLDILEGAAPRGIDVARVRVSMGEAYLELGRNAEAVAALEDGSERLAVLAPFSAELALAQYHLSRALEMAGRVDPALALAELALGTIESQMLRLGGGRTALARYRARFEKVYKHHAALLLRRGGEPDELLQLMERYRSHLAVRHLQSRDLGWSQDLPPDLARELQQFQATFDRALSRLQRGGDEQVIAAARLRLAELRRERERLTLAVRTAAPRATALRLPAVPDTRALTHRLPDDVAVISYLTLPEELLAVTVVDATMELHRTSIPAAILGQQVDSLSTRIQLGQDPAPDLYRTLIAPLLDRIGHKRRLLVLTDGPLSELPFAALNDGQRYLIERFSLAYADSLTAYLLPAAASRPGPSIAVFDPRPLPPGSWAELPFARTEVKRMAELLPPVEQWHGARASEAAVRDLSGHFRVLHFATHASVNPVWPLESFLLLAHDGSGETNGQLQAWEVFANLRLSVELVTLSACSTAAGVPAGGDGLLGFNQAFHYAGARNVLSTQWPVSDIGTAEMMGRFYRHVSRGAALDLALQSAQRELLAAPLEVRTRSWWRNLFGATRVDARAPLYWAPFRLSATSTGKDGDARFNAAP